MPTTTLSLRPRLNRIVRSWYPWITSEDCNLLDRSLNRKISSVDRITLVISEILIALKWYGSIPDGFRSDADNYAARYLSEQAGYALVNA